MHPNESAKKRQDESYLAAIKILPFQYTSKPGVEMRWDDRLRALVRHARPDAWANDRHALLHLVTITEHMHGFAAAAHLVGSTSFFTAFDEVVSGDSPVDAMRLAVDTHPFLRGYHLDRFGAPDIDAAWEGLLEVYVGSRPVEGEAPSMTCDLDSFDRFSRSAASGGTIKRIQIIGRMVRDVVVIR